MSLGIAGAQRLSCPDCLVARRGMLSAILGSPSGACLLHSHTLEARADLPQSWFERYAFAVIRRGIVVRQRMDPSGERVAIDAAGPGSLLPLRMARGAESSTGYAASRLIVCVYPCDTLELGVAGETTLADLLGLQQQALDRLERIAAARGRASAVEQVFALLEALLESIAPLREGEPKPIDLSQRDMAMLLRLRPETVCRAIRTLEQRRAIERTPDGWMVTELGLPTS
jgi:CRP-like cAMP-binding protein